LLTLETVAAVRSAFTRKVEGRHEIFDKERVPGEHDPVIDGLGVKGYRERRHQEKQDWESPQQGIANGWDKPNAPVGVMVVSPSSPEDRAVVSECANLTMARVECRMATSIAAAFQMH
jgi:hypothetical protein